MKKTVFLTLIVILFFSAVYYFYFLPKKKLDYVVIGHLHLSPVDMVTFKGFREGMKKQGYPEGQSIDYLYGGEGSANDLNLLDDYAEELVKKKVDLIFASSTPVSLAVKRATKTQKIPTIFCPVNDPISIGLIKSIRQPGDNITGVRLASGDKLRLQLLLKIQPNAKKIFFPFNPKDKSALKTLQDIQEIITPLGIEFDIRKISNEKELKAALVSLSSTVDAIYLPRDSTIESFIADFVEVALERKIPIAAPSLAQVEAGALFSYGHHHYDLGMQCATLVNQILQGAEPAELPVETANYYFDVNINTAKKIGLTIPNSLLRSANITIL